MYAEKVSFDTLRLKRVSQYVLSCMTLIHATRGIKNPWSAMRIHSMSHMANSVVTAMHPQIHQYLVWRKNLVVDIVRMGV